MKKKKQFLQISKPLRDSKFFDRIRVCKRCDLPMVATCDRNKPSELVETMGSLWMKTKPQFMWVYPTKKKQPRLCFYCRDIKEEWIA